MSSLPPPPLLESSSLWRTATIVAIRPYPRRCSPRGGGSLALGEDFSLFFHLARRGGSSDWGCSALHCSDWVPVDHDLGVWPPLFAGHELLLWSVSPPVSPCWFTSSAIGALPICPSIACHGGRAGWIPVAAGYPPRHRAGHLVVTSIDWVTLF